MDLIYSGVVFVLSEVPCLYLVMTLLTLAYCTFVHFQLHLSGSLLLLSWSCSRLDRELHIAIGQRDTSHKPVLP